MTDLEIELVAALETLTETMECQGSVDGWEDELESANKAIKMFHIKNGTEHTREWLFNE